MVGKRRAVGCGERLGAVVEDFNVAEMAGEKRTEIETGEETHVVALEEMPRSDETVGKERKRFEIGDGEESVAAGDAGDFAKEGVGIAHVLENLDGDDGVEFGVTRGEAVGWCGGRGRSEDGAMREQAAGEFGETRGGGFAAGPSVSERAQGGVKRADAAADIEDVRCGRKVVGEELDALGIGVLGGMAGGVEVFAVKETGFARVAEIAVRSGGVIVGVKADREGRERERRGVGEFGVELDLRGGSFTRGFETREKTEARERGGWELKSGGNVGARIEASGGADFVGCGAGDDAADGGLRGAEMEPALDGDALAVEGGAGLRGVDVELERRAGG